MAVEGDIAYVKCYWGVVRRVPNGQSPCIGCCERNSDDYRCQGDYPLIATNKQEYLDYKNSNEIISE
jgi:hypothetical protein